MSKFIELTHAFRDEWAEEGEQEKEIAFSFAKPSTEQIKRLQQGASKNAIQAQRDLLIFTVLPEQKEELKEVLDAYPLLGTTFITRIMKSLGVDATGN